MKLQRQIAKARVELTLPVALLMAANAWSASETVPYINADGMLATANCRVMDQTYLNGHHATLEKDCFVLRGNIEFNLTLKSAYNISLILEDGASLTINFKCQSEGDHLFQSDGNIRIFGQKNQTGSLTVNNTGSSFGRGLSAEGTIQIYGGHITVTSSGKDAIWAQNNIEIYGGYVSTTCTSTSTKPVYVGIKSETGNININWANSF